ncbi:MAG: DUF819 family protein [Bacillus subtilis]|nr:DUF819 family protein [Bacillus subtilis]
MGEARKLSRMVLSSFGSLILAVTIASAVGFYTFGRFVDHGAEIAGMAVGLYTGGTPNYNAIANIFGLDATTRGIANLADIITGGVFYVFLLCLEQTDFKQILETIQNKPIHGRGHDPGQCGRIQSEWISDDEAACSQHLACGVDRGLVGRRRHRFVARRRRRARPDERFAHSLADDRRNRVWHRRVVFKKVRQTKVRTSSAII